jgi:preprotein translocase subunit SecA
MDVTNSAPQEATPPPPPPSVPTRAPHTTIDALEREFQRNKQRDLDAARSAGGTATATQRRTTNEVGRNEPCFCGSGKKYKKCHGANA